MTRHIGRGLHRICPPWPGVMLDCFSPGPLTVVLPKKETISELVTAGLETVGVRVPASDCQRNSAVGSCPGCKHHQQTSRDAPVERRGKQLRRIWMVGLMQSLLRIQAVSGLSQLSLIAVLAHRSFSDRGQSLLSNYKRLFRKLASYKLMKNRR